MAQVTRKVRVIRTWDAEVEAVYGDTDDMLKAKVTEEHLDATPPDADTRVILPPVLMGVSDSTSPPSDASTVMSRLEKKS